jgi:hypothetical protein
MPSGTMHAMADRLAHLAQESGMQPQLPIDVDADTGVWSTNGLPMLYVPRHFFINNHLAIEAALGRRVYADSLYEAGYRSAHFWCGSEAQTHGLKGMEVFEHYLSRLSQRGWGQFSFIEADEVTGNASIRLDNSCLCWPRAWPVRRRANTWLVICLLAGLPVPWTGWAKTWAMTTAPSAAKASVPAWVPTTAFSPFIPCKPGVVPCAIRTCLRPLP